MLRRRVARGFTAKLIIAGFQTSEVELTISAGLESSYFYSCVEKRQLRIRKSLLYLIGDNSAKVPNRFEFTMQVSAEEVQDRRRRIPRAVHRCFIRELACSLTPSAEASAAS